MKKHQYYSKLINEPLAAGEVAAPCPIWLRGKYAVAQYLGGISVRTIDHWITQKVLPFTRCPGSRLMLFRISDVEKTLKRFSVEASV